MLAHAEKLSLTRPLPTVIGGAPARASPSTTAPDDVNIPSVTILERDAAIEGRVARVVGLNGMKEMKVGSEKVDLVSASADALVAEGEYKEPSKRD